MWGLNSTNDFKFSQPLESRRWSFKVQKVVITFPIPVFYGSVVFVPTPCTDGLEFDPSTRSQPARLGEMVEQQDYEGP